MTRYMLDTNLVSHFVRQHPNVIHRAVSIPIDLLCLSVITEAELLFGLARRPEATRLNLGVQQFLSRVDVLPLDSKVAAMYASLRADSQLQGIILAPFDLLIAAHALSAKTVLVTNDEAFKRTTALTLEDWTIQQGL